MSDGTCKLDGCAKRTHCGSLICPMHSARWRNHGSYDKPAARPLQEPKPCKVPGCTTMLQCQGTVCPKHRTRMERTGSYDLRTIPPSTHVHGYVIVHRPGHVLAVNNKVYEHRAVLFDRIGYGPHLCEHCQTHINWRAGLEADHLDRDRANNAASNIAASCHPCNIRRAPHRNQYSPPTEAA